MGQWGVRMEEQRVWVLAPGDDAWARYLKALGWRVDRFLDGPALRLALNHPGVRAPDALVLMADVASNCRVAEAVRTRYPALILVALLGRPTGAEPAALLRVGVDCILRPDDSPAQMASALRALGYRRALGDCAEQPQFSPRFGGDAIHRIGPWRLVEQGWRLTHQDGAFLRLTGSERAVLLCLFEAPGHVASHADIIGAVRQGWRPMTRTPDGDPKCRDIISRLRMRARVAGLREPPVESLRDFGYAWAL